MLRKELLTMKPEKSAWLAEIKRLDTSIWKTQFFYVYFCRVMLLCVVAAVALALYTTFKAIVSFSDHQGTTEQLLWVLYLSIPMFFFMNAETMGRHLLIERLFRLSDERAHLKRFGWNNPKKS